MEKGKNWPLIKKVLIWTLFIISLWVVKSAEHLFHIQLYWLGILPRTAKGLVGIITAPFIHGNLSHLASNTLPLFFLGWGIIYFFEKISLRIIMVIYLLSDILVWLIARNNYHIGASGLIYGFASFLIGAGIISRNRSMLSIALLISLFYGGMVWGLLPLDNGISWEAHLSGLLSGILAAFIFRKHLPKKDKYQWEEEETAEENEHRIDKYHEVPPHFSREE